MSAAAAHFDVIVIGAGINGAAIAREAALAGLTVLLLEQSDLGSGTSAASTRLIHGGLRYLEHAELKLVYESLHERERLLRLAPHLVTPLGLYLPIYRTGRRRRWQVRAGMWLYDLLSLGKSVPRHRMLDAPGVLEVLPGLTRDGLVGAAHYYDAQVAYPERLIVELVRDAVANGAELRTHTRVTKIDVVAKRACGVEWRSSDGAVGQAEAPRIVNATGPWVDRVVGELSKRKLLGATKGSHVVCKPFPGAPNHAVYAEAADGRPFFVIPWNELYLIGTTDERFNGDPGQIEIDADEYGYLLAAAEALFPTAAPLDRYVCYTQAGVRPLPRSSASRTAAITRRHLIHEHRRARGLYSIVGGKLTTHRALAEDVLLRSWRRQDRSFVSATRERPFPGALDLAARDELAAALTAQLGAAQAARLWRIYGAQAAAIASLARSSKELATVLGSGAGPLVAELVYAVREEWASSLADILLRRCMAGLAADRGLDCAPAAADWLVRLGLWERSRGDHELEAYRALVRRFVPRGGAALASIKSRD
jgi:glycerol-3-phosphate dehydrogenase